MIHLNFVNIHNVQPYNVYYTMCVCRYVSNEIKISKKYIENTDKH